MKPKNRQCNQVRRCKLAIHKFNETGVSLKNSSIRKRQAQLKFERAPLATAAQCKGRRNISVQSLRLQPLLRWQMQIQTIISLSYRTAKVLLPNKRDVYLKAQRQTKILSPRIVFRKRLLNRVILSSPYRMHRVLFRLNRPKSKPIMSLLPPVAPQHQIILCLNNPNYPKGQLTT